MGTLRRLGTAIGRKGFRLRFWLIFAGILGFTSTVLSLVDKHLSWLQAVALTLISLAVALAASRKQMREAQLSVNDVLPEEIGHVARTRVECPCSSGVAQQASRLAQECYGTHFTISATTYEAIWLKNPEVLAALVNEEGNLLGYFDVIPLKDAFAQLFIEGRVTEDQLRHDDVCTVSERAHCKYLFVAGLAVWSPESFSGRRNASMLVWALLRYMEHYYGSMQPLVFAVAATEEGDDILRRFKLKLTTDAVNRPDNHCLYSVRLSDYEITRRLACLPDWRGLCVLPWNDNLIPVRSIRPTLPQIRHHRLEPAI
ncbi:MAG TPA: hypothetical protein VN784_04500 [Candidatus Limnocylindrales bacterium]|nr:hypothetical protein [Candidatus Limnocylindrales bacterium]